jgi:thermitase
MSYAQRIWLLSSIITATIVVLLVFQGGTQEVESQAAQDEAPPGSSDEPSFPAPDEAEFKSDKIIVKVEDDVSDAELDRLNRENGARTEEDLPRSDVSVVDLPRDLPVEEAVEVYEDAPEVEYAEPDYLLAPSQTTTTNDPEYGKLYGLNNTGQNGGTADADVDAPEAWSTSTGDPGTLVAVIDTGVDINHPDLKDNIWVNTDEIAGNGVDDDNNGYVDDRNGYDFANNDASVYDPDPISGAGDEHGTHVAGTIAGEGNNSLGVAGVSWRASIMPVKFLGPSGGYTSDAVEAINYAVRNGAKISNNSWGGGGYSQALRDAIANADASGHLFVAAAGNGGADGVGDDNDATPSYPASYDLPNIISVAATDRNDALAGFSNFGANSVDVAAPGVSILSTLPDNTYGAYSGTSMATPHVSGIAALIKSERPELDDAQIKAQILQFAEKKGGLSGKTVTGGRANAVASLTEQAAPPPDTTAPNTGISSGPLGTVRSNSASFAFTASEAGKFRCSLDGAAFSDCASPKSYSSLASRTHTFRVAAVDAAGNVDPTPATRTWTVDTIRPTVTSNVPKSGSRTRDTTPNISAIVRDSQTNLAKGNLKLFIDGKQVAASAFSYNASTDKMTHTARRLSYARHSVRLDARDRAGNVVSKRWSFYVVR